MEARIVHAAHDNRPDRNLFPLAQLLLPLSFPPSLSASLSLSLSGTPSYARCLLTTGFQMIRLRRRSRRRSSQTWSSLGSSSSRSSKTRTQTCPRAPTPMHSREKRSGRVRKSDTAVRLEQFLEPCKLDPVRSHRCASIVLTLADPFRYSCLRMYLSTQHEKIGSLCLRIDPPAHSQGREKKNCFRRRLSLAPRPRPDRAEQIHKDWVQLFQFFPQVLFASSAASASVRVGFFFGRCVQT